MRGGISVFRLKSEQKIEDEENALAHTTPTTL